MKNRAKLIVPNDAEGRQKIAELRKEFKASGSFGKIVLYGRLGPKNPNAFKYKYGTAKARIRLEDAAYIAAYVQ